MTIYGDDGTTPIGGQCMVGDWYYLEGVDPTEVPPDWVNMNVSVALARGYIRMDDSNEAAIREAEAQHYTYKDGDQ